MSGFGIVPAEVYAVEDAYAIAVYAILAKHADASGECWPSVATIAASLHVGVSTVKRALTKLRTAGVVTAEHRFAQGMKQANSYRLVFHNSANVQMVPTEPTIVPTEPMDGSHRTDGWSPENHKQDSIEQDSIEQEGVNPPTPQKRAPTYSEDFEQRFWTAYPSGHGSKKHAYAEWKKLNDGDRTAAAAGIASWKLSDQWMRGYIVHAERFLKRRDWENPPSNAPPVPTSNGMDKSARARASIDAFLDIAGIKRHDD